jgi:hypothetical protein
VRPEPFKKWTRKLRLRRRLSAHIPSAGGNSLSIDFVNRPQQPDLVELRRDGRRLTLLLAARETLLDDRTYFIFRVYMPVVLYVFSRTNDSVTGAIAELNDGSTVRSDHLLFCSTHRDSLLIPDPEFFNSNAHDDVRRTLPRQRSWSERNDRIVWRGSSTGGGEFPGPDLDLAAPNLKQRIRMCGVLKSIPGVDAKIHRVVQSEDAARDEERLRQAGVLGDRIASETWLDQKFALDIDDNTNAWTNFYIRLLYGCCVIKVGSPAGFRQWYYHRLEPWKHFVPVRADLGDLVERIQWCREHAAECAQIAANGRALALSMTLESETAFAIGRINLRLGMKQEVL